MKLLLIEDDLPLADGLARALRQVGYHVDTATRVADACRLLDGDDYGLVILDLGLPDLDGSEVVRYLTRKDADTPVLVLSARDGLEERIRLLDIGADDYLVKPAAMEEFLARVRAMLRRRRAEGETRLNLGRLSLDMDGKRAWFDGQVLDLNGREWTLLAFFASSPNRVVSKDDIAEVLHRSDEAITVNAVDQIMSRFRKRIADTGLNLRTVRGLGYYLEVDDGSG
jgi:two-component system, OmpR family, response regulator